jgi:replicative DNA helicase
MLSQMNRNIENSAKNRLDIGKQLPVASDLFGSDSIFQASEFVLALHRPGSYGLTQFPMGDVNFSTGLSRIGAGDDDLMVEVVLKNRNGSIATILLNHNLAHNDFTDYKQKMTI